MLENYNYTTIDDKTEIHPGEFLFHVPTNQVVICRRYDKEQEKINSVAGGSFLEDITSNYRKISHKAVAMDNPSQRSGFRRNCGGCKSRGSGTGGDMIRRREMTWKTKERK